MMLASFFTFPCGSAVAAPFSPFRTAPLSPRLFHLSARLRCRRAFFNFPHGSVVAAPFSPFRTAPLSQLCRCIIYAQRLIFRPRPPRLRPQRRPVQVVRLAPAALALHGSQKAGLRRQVRRAPRTRRRLEPHLLLAGELRDVISRSIVREDDSQQLAFFVHSFHLIFGL